MWLVQLKNLAENKRLCHNLSHIVKGRIWAARLQELTVPFKAVECEKLTLNILLNQALAILRGFFLFPPSPQFISISDHN